MIQFTSLTIKPVNNELQIAHGDLQVRVKASAANWFNRLFSKDILIHGYLVSEQSLAQALDVLQIDISYARAHGSLENFIKTAFEAKKYGINYFNLEAYKQQSPEGEVEYLEYLADALNKPLLELLIANKDGHLKELIEPETKLEETFPKIEKLFENEPFQTVVPDPVSEFKIVPVKKEELKEIIRNEQIIGKVIRTDGDAVEFQRINLLEGKWDTGEVLKIRKNKDIQDERNILNKIHFNGDLLGIQKKLKFIFLSNGYLSPSYDGNLSDNKRQLLKFSLSQRLSLVYQLLHGVSKIHEMQIRHGNIKPEHILCRFKEKNPSVYLADFGDNPNAAAETDVFDLCATLYLIYTGEEFQPQNKFKKAGLSDKFADLLLLGLNEDCAKRPSAKKLFEAARDEMRRVDLLRFKELESQSAYRKPPPPSGSGESIIQFIKKIGESPEKEILGRFLWKELSTIKRPVCYLAKEKRAKTKCATTFEGLMVGLFGPDFDNIVKKFSYQYEDWSIFKGAMEANANELASKKEKVFTIGFSLNAADWFGGHAFIVLQYLDKEGNVRYRFFQSNIDEYTLKEYLHKGCLDIGHQEFLNFIEEVRKCAATNTWTEEMENFCAHYFGITNPGKIGASLYQTIDLTISWGECTIENILKKKQDFENEIKKETFPKICLIPEEKFEECNNNLNNRSTDSSALIAVDQYNCNGIEVNSVNPNMLQTLFKTGVLNPVKV